MNLLFITHANLARRPYGDGSTRYRCFNVAEVALAEGHTAQVMELDRIRPKELSQFDLISWLRPVSGRKAFNVINSASALNIPCIADIDDLIFDPELAAESPAVINGFISSQQVEKRFSAHASVLQHFDALTVSTTTLQQHVKRCFAQLPVVTVHNGLSSYWLQHADRFHAGSNRTGKIAYLPGTRSHDQDLASIRGSLVPWLQAMPHASLEIVGKIDISKHRMPSTRVSHHPWVDYYQLPAIMKRHCASLAPLTRSRFNAAKSHVKFIESAALGVPLIASPNNDLEQHNIAGLLLAESPEQWLEALKQVSQSGFLENTAEGLSLYARQYCSAEHYARPLIKAWQDGHLLPGQCPETALVQAA